MNIRLATDKDIDTILETFECAKKYMRASGNSRQWNGSYPDRGLMLSEIAAGHCHVVETGEGLLAGTFCLILGPDPTYADPASYMISRKWQDNSCEPYSQE